MRGRSLIPRLGDREARQAWDTVFSRETLGSVVLGGAAGKTVEQVIALVVIFVVGPDAPAFWTTVGYLAAWLTALPIGIWLFVYWHHVAEAAKEAAEQAGEKAKKASEKAKEKAGDDGDGDS